MSAPFLKTEDTDFLFKSKVFAGMLLKRALVGPYLVVIQGNYSCNYQCVFCEWFSPMVKEVRNEIHRPHGYMDMDVYRGLIRELSLLGTKLVLIGDLEPFMDTQLIEKIEYAKKYDLGVVIITNGSLINEENAEKMVNLKLDYLNVSLNAATPETYPQIHVGETAQTFERIVSMMSFIEELKEKNGTTFPRTRLSMVVCNRNYQDIVKFVELCKKTGVKDAHLKKLIPPSKEIAEQLELTPEQTEEMKNYLAEARKTAEECGVNLNIEWADSQETQKQQDDLPCYYGWLFSMIDENGNVHPCCFQNRGTSCTIGNLKQDSFTKIWFSKKYQNFRRNYKNTDNRKKIGYQCNHPSCFFNNKQIHNILNAPYLLPFRHLTKAKKCTLPDV